MAYPKITYGSGPTTLLFSLPPIKAPAFSLEWVGHVNASSAGVRERIAERIDTIALDDGELQFQVPNAFALPGYPGAKLEDWQTFMEYALAGGSFNYYADSSLGSFVTCTLADDVKSWKAAFQANGPWYTFKLRLLQAVSWP